MKRSIVPTIALIIIVFIGCKKEKQSLSLKITSFILPISALQQNIVGVIKADSIILTIKAGTVLTSVTPVVMHNGQSISPAVNTPINLSSPVVYTITGSDGSTKRYTVVVVNAAITKQLLDFRIKRADNPSLANDLVGSFINDSTVFLQITDTNNLRTLKPSISHNGMSVSPGNLIPNDFTKTSFYTVTAEDGSTKKYEIIASANKTVFISTTTGYLYALNANTGEVRWSMNSGLEMGSPTYYNGRVYVGAKGGFFYCLNAETGAVIWSVRNLGFRDYTIPCVYNNKVYVSSVDYDRRVKEVIAMDANTGATLWVKFIVISLNLTDHLNLSPVTVTENRVALSDYQSGLYVLDATTGDLIWNNRTGLVLANPLVKDGVFYIATEAYLSLKGYSMVTGNEVWVANLSRASLFSSPLLHNNIIYISSNLSIMGVNKSDGSVAWRGDFDLAANDRPVPSISDQDSVMAIATQRSLDFSVNLRDRKLNWVFTDSRYDTNPSSPTSPVAACGMMFLRRKDDKFYALSIRTGAVLWQFTPNGKPLADPCMVDIVGRGTYTVNSGHNN